MAYTFIRTEKFKEQVGKLDGRMQELVLKKMDKILENPLLGKPLHSPLHTYRSERIEKYRIIYKINSEVIEFAWLDHRKHVYD